MVVHSDPSPLPKLKRLCSKLCVMLLNLQQYQRVIHHLITSDWPCFLFYFYLHYCSHPHSTLIRVKRCCASCNSLWCVAHLVVTDLMVLCTEMLDLQYCHLCDLTCRSHINQRTSFVEKKKLPVLTVLISLLAFHHVYSGTLVIVIPCHLARERRIETEILLLNSASFTSDWQWCDWVMTQ